MRYLLSIKFFSAFENNCVLLSLIYGIHNRMILKTNRDLSIMFKYSIEGRERCIDHIPIKGMKRTVNITVRYNTNIVVFTLNAPSTPIDNFGCWQGWVWVWKCFILFINHSYEFLKIWKNYNVKIASNKGEGGAGFKQGGLKRIQRYDCFYTTHPSPTMNNFLEFFLGTNCISSFAKNLSKHHLHIPWIFEYIGIITSTDWCSTVKRSNWFQFLEI